VALVAVGGQIEETETHTPIASRWNYNEHLFPIFRDNCGSCHRDGGIAPMSLVTYRSAYPWAQSIREEVLGLRMPPWKAEDGFGDFRNGHALPAHEMDMILEWSSGGYPQGPRSQSPAPPGEPEEWPLGAPAVELRMAEPFTLDWSTNESVRYFVLPTGTTEELFVTGADVMPGAAAIVRDVAIYIDATGTARALDAEDDGPGFGEAEGRDFPTTAPLALWSPGRPSVRQDGAARSLPAGADVVARVHYKKTWITEGLEFTDRTQLGLHLADGEADAIEQTVVDATAEPAGRELTFRHVFDDGTTLLALLPEVAVGSSELQVEGVLPDGSRQPLLLIREPDPAWPTRYWLEEPLDLPAGSALQVTATLEPGAGSDDVPSLFGSDAPLRVLVDHTDGTPVAD
jgi:hypothetical protein